LFLVIIFLEGVVSSISSSSLLLHQAALDFEAISSPLGAIPDPRLRAKERERDAQYQRNLLDAAVSAASISISSISSASSASESSLLQDANANHPSSVRRTLRLLSQNSNYGEYSYYNNNNNNGESSSSSGQQQLGDDLDYNDSNDEEDYSYWDHNLVQKDFGFYISSYSFKYTGCHNVVDKDNAMYMERYATFRLCPSSSCYEWKTNGCSSNSNYGEYAVPLHLYLSALVDYHQGRVVTFCDYCQSCAMVEAYKSFVHDMMLRQLYIVQYAKTQFQSWLLAQSQSSSSSNNDNAVEDNQYLSAS
jgi:hypothetical protein